MNTFRKEERLCSKVQLDLLFKNGSSFLLYPYRCTFLKVEAITDVPVQVVINVSKKRYKRAVDRNLIKRRTRELYRLNKEAHLYAQLPVSASLLLSIQFIGKSIYPSSVLDEKLKRVFARIVRNFTVDAAH